MCERNGGREQGCTGAVRNMEVGMLATPDSFIMYNGIEITIPCSYKINLWIKTPCIMVIIQNGYHV